ncbi:MAG: hypothetical protein KGR26_00690, partial [Cyanobacteria bacterium REEB65]|nr:hypothetical protein [Cyanobacteria bacterium REEB65]
VAAPIVAFHDAIAIPHPAWFPASIVGAFFGLVAFFSVFIFMFKGRTATFAGLVNRLTSLLAGTTATLLSFFIYKAAFPGAADWASLALILIAVAFLSRAERRRMTELVQTHELDTTVPAADEGRPIPAPAQ